MISLSALALVGIAVNEGYRERAYDDGVGVQTVGYGTTTRDDGSAVRSGDTLSPERALVRLSQDAQSTARRVAGCLDGVAMAPHEFDAYVSLAYNIGGGAFCGSTLVRRLRQTPPDYAGACREILRWTRAGGRELRGLVARRQQEYQLCTRGRE